MMTLSWRDVERMASTHLGVIEVGLGITIIAGGPIRFPPPTYQALLDATGGRVWPYGITFMIFGFLLIFPSVRANFLAHIASIVNYNVFAALFFISAIHYPEAGATAWWIYFSMGSLHGFNLALMHVRRKQHLYPELEKPIIPKGPDQEQE